MDAQNGHAIQDTPPRADVDEMLRRKRKARDYKVGTVAYSSVQRTQLAYRFD